MPIDVKTSVFEGPLEVLLELIESRKLLINDISLAGVCDEYIARVSAMENLPLSEATDFTALAATLLLIKSRSLLPTLNLTSEESRDIKELEYRLALYKLVRDGARAIERQFGKTILMEGESKSIEPRFAPDEQLGLEELFAAAKRLIDEFPKPIALPSHTVATVISLEEMIERLGTRINAAIKLSFKEFSGHGTKGIGEKDKREIIVSFLALLELVKQGSVRASQHSEFDDIMLEGESVSTPSYI